MENAAPVNMYQINISICHECGLPLKIYSYEKNNADITIKLFCQNLSHKKINEIKFELYQKLINDNLNNLCKCALCNQIINNKDNSFYCYDCRKIVCSDCLNNKHDLNHKNTLKYENLKNKCLVHNSNDNDIIFYCLDCKINMCKYCLTQDLEHSQVHNVKEIQKLMNENKGNINNILQEQEKYKKSRNDILKTLNNMNNKINFNEFLLKEQNNYFHLFNLNNSSNNIFNFQNNNNNDLDFKPKTLIIKKSINNKNMNNYKSMNNNNVNNNGINNNIQDSLIFNNNYNKDNNEKTTLNIIYHDENIKYNDMSIINDCQMIQHQTKFPLILTNDIINLNLLLKNLMKNKTKSKFILIVNGASAEKTINFIIMNYYRPLFVNACIYTANINKYLKVKYTYQDFIENIYCDCYAIINFINICFQNLKIFSERFYINQIISFFLYKNDYSKLHKEISTFYGDESKEAFFSNFNKIKTFISNSNEFQQGIKDNLINNCFQSFSELSNKNYENIISCFLKDNNFSTLINSLLMKKDINIYQYISYFVGNLMHSLVEYGKKKGKGVNKGTILYKGLQMNIVDLLEFLKNRGLMITFPHFLSMGEIQSAEISSKRNAPEIDRKNKDYYSVILKISYLYDDYFEPNIFEIKDLASYPDEEEYIMLPFTFMKLTKIIIDSNKYTSDIELEVVGREEILEYQLKDKSKNLEYDKPKSIMIVK